MTTTSSALVRRLSVCRKRIMDGLRPSTLYACNRRGQLREEQRCLHGANLALCELTHYIRASGVHAPGRNLTRILSREQPNKTKRASRRTPAKAFVSLCSLSLGPFFPWSPPYSPPVVCPADHVVRTVVDRRISIDR